MKKILLFSLFTALSLFAADGQSLSAKCVACHGAVFEKAALGKSAIVYGQSASDIYEKLIAYKQGTRNTAGMGALMKGQTASMSNNDLWAVAEYIASLSEEPVPAAEAAPVNDWLFACEPSDLEFTKDNRYFKGSFGVGVDSKTIKIDKKNKKVMAWTVWLASEEDKLNYIQKFGQYNDYSNYGYSKQLTLIHYGNMQTMIKSFTHYSCSGKVIYTTNGDNNWEDVIPGSVMEGITERIMKKYNLK